MEGKYLDAKVTQRSMYELVDWFGVGSALYMRRPLVGCVGLYMAGRAHLGRLLAFAGCAALPVSLGV